MSQRRSKLFVKRYLYWILVTGVTFIVAHILAGMITGQVGRAIGDLGDWFGDWQSWKLVLLPAFVGGGLLMTLAERLELKLKHKKRRLDHQ